jgi:hypothetical protein
VSRALTIPAFIFSEFQISDFQTFAVCVEMGADADMIRNSENENFNVVFYLLLQ